MYIDHQNNYCKNPTRISHDRYTMFLDNIYKSEDRNMALSDKRQLRVPPIVQDWHYSSYATGDGQHFDKKSNNVEFIVECLTVCCLLLKQHLKTASYGTIQHCNRRANVVSK